MADPRKSGEVSFLPLLPLSASPASRKRSAEESSDASPPPEKISRKGLTYVRTDILEDQIKAKITELIAMLTTCHDESETADHSGPTSHPSVPENGDPLTANLGNSAAECQIYQDPQSCPVTQENDHRNGKPIQDRARECPRGSCVDGSGTVNAKTAHEGQISLQGSTRVHNAPHNEKILNSVTGHSVAQDGSDIAKILGLQLGHLEKEQIQQTHSRSDRAIKIDKLNKSITAFIERYDKEEFQPALFGARRVDSTTSRYWPSDLRQLFKDTVVAALEQCIPEGIPSFLDPQQYPRFSFVCRIENVLQGEDIRFGILRQGRRITVGRFNSNRRRLKKDLMIGLRLNPGGSWTPEGCAYQGSRFPLEHFWRGAKLENHIYFGHEVFIAHSRHESFLFVLELLRTVMMHHPGSWKAQKSSLMTMSWWATEGNSFIFQRFRKEAGTDKCVSVTNKVSTRIEKD